MKHLDFEKARQETSVFNSLIRSEVLDSSNDQPIDQAIEQGIELLN